MGSPPSQSRGKIRFKLSAGQGYSQHMIKLAPGSSTVWSFMLVCALTAAIYLPGLAGDYVFDDRPNLLDNKRLQLDTLDMESLQSAALSSGAGTLRRPVSMASFALNRYFFGVSPYSYKAVNLVIHLLTGLGLFLFSRLLLRAYRRCNAPVLPDAASVWLPVVVSGLWLVHPLNLTPVLYIVQRMTSLATLFLVCGLCLYVTGRLRMLDNRRGLPLILAGLLAFGGLAIFSKENGVLLPLYMLVVEMTLFRFRGSNGQADKKMIIFFLVTVAIPAGLLLLYLAMHPTVILGGYRGRNFTLTERLLTESRVLVFYLKLIIVPSITELGLYHDDITVSHGLLGPPTTLYSLITLSGLLLGALMLLKKRPLISLGILWFFAGHVLESTVYPLEIAHEHRNYLADYGILLAASMGVAQAPLQRMAPVIRTTVPLLFLILFSSTTWLRANQWSDNINQAIYEARHHPDSVRAVFAAGRIHGRLAIQGQPGSEEKAYAYLAKAGKLDTVNIMPEVAEIKLSYLLGNPVKDVWFQAILHKLANKPLTASDISSLKELASCIGDTCDVPPETMESIFALALKHENAILLSVYGYYTINKRGNFPKGLALFNRAVKLSPREPQLWINLIKLLVVMQRPDEAEETLTRFIAADTHGGNSSDYHRLQKSINELRKMQSSSTQSSSSGDG
jgi:tetratricopeptide (TPR) repeat protein